MLPVCKTHAVLFFKRQVLQHCGIIILSLPRQDPPSSVSTVIVIYIHIPEHCIVSFASVRSTAFRTFHSCIYIRKLIDAGYTALWVVNFA